jgi:peptide/nickel transport system substrate-binding protein
MGPTKKTAAALAATALAIGLAACGGGGGSDAGAPPAPITAGDAYNPQPRDNIKDGGTLTDSLPEISSQFNTFQGDSTLYSTVVWDWYNPLLVTFSPTGDVQFNPDYLVGAPKSEVVNGNTTLTYTINPKATYNDGTPIDWKSFEATWKADNGTDSAYSVLATDGYSQITSVTQGTDAKQAVVTFKGVYVWYTSLFNNLLNPEALAPDTFNKGYLDTPHAEWGAGPYTVTKYDKQNSTIVFERNPKWWGDPGKLDTHTILGLETDARINAFKNGQLDAAYTPSAEQLNQVKNMPNIEIRKSTSPGVYLLQFNAKSPTLTDPALRKGIMEGIDRSQIAKITFQGLDYTEPLPGSLATLPFQPGYKDNFSSVITYDVNKAKADLDAAGYAAGQDGMRSKDGKPATFAFVYNGNSATSKAVAAAVGQMMKAIGVDMQVRQLPSSDFSSVISGRSFDVFFSGFAQTDPNGLAYFCQVYCSNSELNLSGSGTAALDTKVNGVSALATADQQIAAYPAVETEAFQTYGTMPMYNGPTITAVKNGLANYGADYGGVSLFHRELPQNVGWQK